MDTKTIFFMLLYMISFILIIYIRKNEWHILTVLVITFIIVMIIYPKINLKMPIIMTLLFGIVENICVHYGIWKYQNVNYPLPYIPTWVYFAWFLSIIFIVRFSSKTFLKT